MQNRNPLSTGAPLQQNGGGRGRGTLPSPTTTPTPATTSAPVGIGRGRGRGGPPPPPPPGGIGATTAGGAGRGGPYYSIIPPDTRPPGVYSEVPPNGNPGAAYRDRKLVISRMRQGRSQMTLYHTVPPPPDGETPETKNERQHMEKEIHYLDRMEEANDFNRETAWMIAKYNESVSRELASYQRRTAWIAAFGTASTGLGGSLGARRIATPAASADNSNPQMQQAEQAALMMMAREILQGAGDPTATSGPIGVSEIEGPGGLQPTTAPYRLSDEQTAALNQPSRRFNSSFNSTNSTGEPGESFIDKTAREAGIPPPFKSPLQPVPEMFTTPAPNGMNYPTSQPTGGPTSTPSIRGAGFPGVWG